MVLPLCLRPPPPLLIPLCPSGRERSCQLFRFGRRRRFASQLISRCPTPLLSSLFHFHPYFPFSTLILYPVLPFVPTSHSTFKFPLIQYISLLLFHFYPFSISLAPSPPLPPWNLPSRSTRSSQRASSLSFASRRRTAFRHPAARAKVAHAEAGGTAGRGEGLALK